MEKSTKIARKLILGIVIFSGILSIIITAMQLYYEFNRDKEIITSQLNAVELTSLPSLKEAVWLSDKGQIEILLSSMQENQNIGYIKLVTDEGDTFQYGAQNLKNSLIQNFNLEYNNAGSLQSIGNLLIKADLNKAYTHLYDRIGFVLVSNSLKTLLVALFIYFMVHTLVIKHLAKITKYLGSFNIDENNEPLTLNRGKLAAQDELREVVTSVNTMTKNLHDAHQQAEAANQAKSNFLANMSHEIRTPMNAILGMANLALDANPDKHQRRYLNRIDTAATSLLRIINDILDFSKIEAGKLEMEKIGFELANVTENITSIAGAKAKQKGLNLNIHIDKNIPPVLVGDPLRLNQVLLNLVNNAIKFTEAGSVEVRIKLKENTEEKIELLCHVRDTGIGLSDEQQSYLFEPFIQADGSTTRQYGGTGLGLTICKHLVTLMGGHIAVESIPDAGSTFYFNAWFEIGTQEMLPKRDDLESTVNLDVLRAKIRGARILLVEDNDINQELAAELLTKAGIQIDIANDGQEAVNMLTDKHGYDGVLMDIQMPVMGGYEATDIIRHKKNMLDLPVIAMTANAMQGDREKCIAAGMNDYISKPINQNELFSVMANWIKPSNPTQQKTINKTKSVEHEYADLFSLPGVDVEQGLKYLNQNTALYRRFILKFRNTHADFAERYRNALSQGDKKTAERLAHTLKSVSATLGAENIRALAVKLEALASETGQDNAINEQLELIEARMAELLPAIDALAINEQKKPNNNLEQKNE